MKKHIRLFFVESVDPMDLLQGRTESRALAEICKIIGHEAYVLTAYSKSDFKKICGYISSINSVHDINHRKNIPLCIHISAHGNERGIGFGKDFLEWDDVMMSMNPIFSEMKDYDGKVVLTISACGASDQCLTQLIQEKYDESDDFVPPEYLFVTTGENVAWDDALVSWAMFYHQLPRANLDTKSSVQRILDKIKGSGTGNLTYFRWDREEGKYFFYSGKEPVKCLTRKKKDVAKNAADLIGGK